MLLKIAGGCYGPCSKNNLKVSASVYIQDRIKTSFTACKSTMVFRSLYIERD